MCHWISRSMQHCSVKFAVFRRLTSIFRTRQLDETSATASCSTDSTIFSVASMQMKNQRLPDVQQVADGLRRTQTSNFADVEPLHRFWLHLHHTTLRRFLFNEGKSRRSRFIGSSFQSGRVARGSSARGLQCCRMLFFHLWTFLPAHSRLVILVLIKFNLKLINQHGNQLKTIWLILPTFLLKFPPHCDHRYSQDVKL